MASTKSEANLAKGLRELADRREAEAAEAEREIERLKSEIGEIVESARAKRSEAERYREAAGWIVGESSPKPLGREQAASSEKSRLEELDDWLLERGGATRKEAIDEEPIPSGTIRALLNRSNFDYDDTTKVWYSRRAKSH